jgi:hypothetical protein
VGASFAFVGYGAMAAAAKELLEGGDLSVLKPPAPVEI